MRFALLLPLVMAIFFAGVFLYGANRIEVSRKEVVDITGQLKLQTYPAFQGLAIVLAGCALLLILIAVGPLLDEGRVSECAVAEPPILASLALNLPRTIECRKGLPVGLVEGGRC
jgi:hypothetical protein